MTLPVLNVLLVEDEDVNIETWQDQVSIHNADADKTGFRIESSFAKSVAEGKNKLRSGHYDAVVVDLRLQLEPGVAEQNDHGNEFVKYVISSVPAGVVIYTGQRAEATDYGCPQVQIMDKGDGLQPVFAWLTEQKDLLLSIRSAKETFDREMAKIFFKSIWPRWKHLTETLKGAELTGMVSRHVVAHVHDSLLDTDEDGAHFEEWYFVPPLRARLDTGDLVLKDNEVWIVVTPRCDLAHEGKTATILIAKCLDISGEWQEAEKAGKLTGKLKELARHKNSPKLHFLVPLRDSKGDTRGPWLVNFDTLLALPAEAGFAELTPTRFASLAPQFVPSLVERFGAYFSRIGTPALSIE